jgi:hypothetical protein
VLSWRTLHLGGPPPFPTGPFFTVLRLLPAIALLVSTLAPVSAQTEGRDGSTRETGSATQVGYLLTADLFTRPSVLAVSAGPISRSERVRVVPYPDRRGWFEVYSASDSRLLGYAYQPYVSRFGAEGPEALPLPEAGVVPAAAEIEEQRSVSLPSPPPPGRQLPEVAFSEPHASSVRCTVRLWSNVRHGPGLGYEAFGVIRPGVPFGVQTMEEGWGMVGLEQYGVGYVSHDLLGCTPAATVPAPLAPLPIGAVSFPHSGELAAAGPAHDFPVAPQSKHDPATHGATQASALRALLTAAGIDPETVVYVAPTNGRFHRKTCEHLSEEPHPLSLTEAMMDHPPCARCVPLTLPSPDAPSDR